MGGGGVGGGGGAGGRVPPNIGGFPGKDAGSDAAVFPTLTDFPADPIIDSSAPANAPALFDGTTPRADGAPCITSPIAGTLMPRNWLRPVFELAPAAGENLFEIALSVPGFAHQLRIFTRNPSTALTADLWNRLRTSINDTTITVTARALQTDAAGAVQLAPSAPAESTFVVAPVDAPGKIVYWALADDMGTKVGSLKGFGIGEEGVRDVLVPSQVASRTSSETCVGCHTATPDGNGVGFSMGPTNYFGNIADIRTGSTGALPSYVNQSAMSMIRTLRGIPAYSKGHWSDGDRIVLLSDTGALNWMQIDGNRRGHAGAHRRRQQGDRAGVQPRRQQWSTSRRRRSSTAAWQRAGRPLLDPVRQPRGRHRDAAAGAADPGATEFYPAFSPDDALVAFTRIAGNGSSTTTRRRRCSWPVRRAPAAPRSAWPPTTRPLANRARQPRPDERLAEVVAAGDHRRRQDLLLADVLVEAQGHARRAALRHRAGRRRRRQSSSYPAMYLWNQPAADDNHTPSWDDFTIPPIIVD